MIFGNEIKKLREERKLLQRNIATQLDIDTPLYSKFERGERLPKKTQISLIAQILETDERFLRVLWVADKLLKDIDEDHEIIKEAVNVVEKELMNIKIKT